MCNKLTGHRFWCWFCRRQEQSACFGFLWMSNGSGTIFAVLISYGVAHLDDAHGIAAWRW